MTTESMGSELDQIKILKAAVDVITERLRANLLNLSYNRKDLEELDAVLYDITSTLRLTYNYVQYHMIYTDSDPKALLAELVRYNNIKLKPAEVNEENIEDLIMSEEELIDLELNAVDFEKEYQEAAEKKSVLPVVEKEDKVDEAKGTRKRAKRK
jgi:hypothetical protein